MLNYLKAINDYLIDRRLQIQARFRTARFGYVFVEPCRWDKVAGYVFKVILRDRRGEEFEIKRALAHAIIEDTKDIRVIHNAVDNHLMVMARGVWKFSNDRPDGVIIKEATEGRLFSPRGYDKNMQYLEGLDG